MIILKKLSWIISGIGALLIVGGLLYPLDMITKNTFIYMLLGGSVTMFIASMIRAYAIMKDK
jgi:hypothetical protein